MTGTGRIIVVPWQWFEEEREREYEQMYQDIESGKTTVEALREKNALRLGDAIPDLSPPKVPLHLQKTIILTKKVSYYTKKYHTFPSVNSALDG